MRPHLNSALPDEILTGLARAKLLPGLGSRIGKGPVKNWAHWLAIEPTHKSAYVGAYQDLVDRGLLEQAYTFAAPLVHRSPTLGFHMPLTEADLDLAEERLMAAVGVLGRRRRPQVTILTDRASRYASSDLAELLIDGGSVPRIELIRTTELPSLRRLPGGDLHLWLCQQAPPRELASELVTINGDRWPPAETLGDILHLDPAPYFAYSAAGRTHVVAGGEIVVEVSSSGQLLVSSLRNELLPLVRFATRVHAADLEGKPFQLTPAA